MPAFAKVLVVDDETHVRAFVAMLVRDTLADATVLEAPDAAGALALFNSDHPELVLLDINLVGPSGLDLLTQMKAANPAAVIVMLTAVSARRTVETALERGANGYILKDVPLDEMANALREIVRDHFGNGNPPSAV